MPLVTVVNRPDLGRYQILCDDDVVGFSAYEMQGTHVAFMHTEIDFEFAGRGLGRKLVGDALADVDSRHATVLPYCPFVRWFIAEDSRFLHLVPEESRRTFGLLGETDRPSDN